MDDFKELLDKDYIKEMKAYAKEYSVPVINDEGLLFLLNSVKDNVNDKILEVGCAIGYSGILMQSVSGGIVHTIERNEGMYNKALEFIKKASKEDSVKVFFYDALELDTNILENDYDIIFIDAAKAQYTKFFLKFTPLLKKGGIVICDNLGFHDLASAPLESLSKNLRGMMKKLNAFKEFLKENTEYETTFFDVGDGMSISIKK